mgnify:CR=1 FL=1
MERGFGNKGEKVFTGQQVSDFLLDLLDCYDTEILYWSRIIDAFKIDIQINIHSGRSNERKLEMMMKKLALEVW